MFWIYNKKEVSTKIKKNKIEFDIRDGLSNKQRRVLFAIYFVDNSPKYEDVITYEHGFTFGEIKKELKRNKLSTFSDNELNDILNGFMNLKYPLLRINENKEICITRIFPNMFEGQEGTDYTQDSVLSSLFPNFLCNGGNGYSSHDISDVFEAINCYINDREISDEKIHEILKDKSDYDLKIILEAFVNHRINILGRLNRIKYDLYDSLSRILKYGSKKEKESLGPLLSIEEYEQLKKEQIKKFGNIDKELIEEFYLSFISLIKLEVYARDNPNSCLLHNSTIQPNPSTSRFENYSRPCKH